MRDGGDFVPSLDTPIIPHTMRSRAFTNPLPGFTKTSSSGDHIRLSGAGSRLQKVERNSKAVTYLLIQHMGNSAQLKYGAGGIFRPNFQPKYIFNF